MSAPGGIAYVATNDDSSFAQQGGIFVTRDYGEHWYDVSRSLPDRSVFALTAGADGTTLHAATVSGVWDLSPGRPPVEIVPMRPFLPAPVAGP